MDQLAIVCFDIIRRCALADEPVGRVLTTTLRGRPRPRCPDITAQRMMSRTGDSGAFRGGRGDGTRSVRIGPDLGRAFLLRRSLPICALSVGCSWPRWAGHYLDSGSDEYQPLIQRACAWGGEGTPEVSEYCAAELGVLQGTGIMAARSLIADALDLRYRLPRLWGRVLTGGVRAWQARRIAEQTRPLSWEACADVDHALSDFVG